MRFLEKMKSFLKSHKDLEDDVTSDAAVHVRPASASVPRVKPPGNDVKPKTVNGLASPVSASPMLWRVDSSHLAAQTRIDRWALGVAEGGPAGLGWACSFVCTPCTAGNLSQDWTAEQACWLA